MNHAKNIVRPLSVSESFYVDFKISVQVVCELKGSLTSDILQTALNHVTKRHPFLACQVIRKNENLYFVRGNDMSVPLRVLQNDRDAVIRSELNTPLDESQNLIRVVMLPGASCCTLIFTLHHAIADGLSTVQLIKDILEGCGDILKFGNPQPIEILPIQPSIETLSSELVTPAELSDFTERFAAQAQSVPLRAIDPQTVEDEHTVVSVEVINVKLSHEDTRKLIQTCKAKQASIHGVIAAAHLIAIRQCLDDSDSELMLRCNTPVDLRQRLTPALEQIHLLSAATGCGTNHAVSAKTSLWELAKEIGSSIQESLDSRDIFKAHHTFMDRMKHRMPTAIGVSSMGLMNIPKTYHELECESLYLTGVYQLPMFGVTVYTYDHQLVMTYLYVQPYYSTELLQKVSRLALEKIFKSV